MDSGSGDPIEEALLDVAAAFGRGTTSDLTPDARSAAARVFADTIREWLGEPGAAWEGEVRRFCVRYAQQIGSEAQALAGEDPITAWHLEQVIPGVFEHAESVFRRADPTSQAFARICCRS